MWCQHCKQDLPAVASATGHWECSQCASEVAADSTVTTYVEFSEQENPAEQLRDWQVDSRMREIGRTLRRPLPRQIETTDPTHYWIDLAHNDSPHAPRAEARTAAQRKSTELPNDYHVQIVAWIATVFGC